MDSDAYTYELEVRYRDLDSRGHVNHAVYVSYVEQVKAAFFEAALGTRLDEAPTVVRTLELDYERSIELGDTLVGSLWTKELGETSFTLGYELTAEGETAATARTVSVLLDEDAGTSRALPDEWRETFEHIERTDDRSISFGDLRD